MGIYFFGGSIHSASGELFEERYGSELSDNMKIFNFNDYYHSFMIMFMIMFTGWGGFDKMVTLNQNPTAWYNIYFVSFFFLSNIIFLNILVGFLCDNTDCIMNAHLAKVHAERQELENNDGADGEDGEDDEDGKGDKGSN